MFGFMLGAQKKARIAMEQLKQEEGADEGKEYDDDILSDDELDAESDSEEEAALRMRRELYWKSWKVKLLGYFGIKPGDTKAEESRPEYPPEYFYKSEYHLDKPFFVRAYLDYVATPSVSVINNESFNNAIIFVIVIAGINVGVQTYPATEGLLFFDILDLFILGMFIMEFFFKLFAEGLRPQRYFVGPEWAWNQFDFIIVVLSFPE